MVEVARMYRVVRDVRSVINKTDNEIIDKLALNTSDSLAEYQKVGFVSVEGGDHTFHRLVPGGNTDGQIFHVKLAGFKKN